MFTPEGPTIMFKKLLLVALVAVIGVVAYRHFNLRLCRADESIESQLRRERDKLPQLDAEIKRYISLVAAREVEVKNLAGDIKNLEEQQKKNRETLKARKGDLQASASLVKDATKTDPEHQRALRDLDRL